jgi:signal transduction histidine kinase
MHAVERGIYLTILSAVFVLSVLFIFFVIVISRYQKRKAELYTEKIRIQTNWLDNEKERIAADLHDDLGASLSAIKFQLHSLELRDEEESLIIENAEKYIDEAMQKLRDISYNMMPRILKDKGLKEAIADLIELPATLNKVLVTFNYTVNDIGDATSLHIYRIIQEIFTNIMRHAKATAVTLSISKRKNILEVYVEDNGIGFNRNELMKKKCQGLQNIRHRAEMLKAEMNVNSLPGKGVDYLIKIPLNSDEHTQNKSNYC